MWVQVPPSAPIQRRKCRFPNACRASEEAWRQKAHHPRFARRLLKVIDFADLSVSKHVLKVGDVFGGRTINISQDGMLINSDYELDKEHVVVDIGP